MKQYLDLCNSILNKGSKKTDRTGTGTISLFGHQMRFNLKEGFPILTTKKIFFKGVVGELLWFLSGSTNIKWLVNNKINIWTEWPFKKYCNSSSYEGENLKEFSHKISLNKDFAKKWGELGPVYGKQWRSFNGCDQFKEVLSNMERNPSSRRHIVSAWNVSEIEDMLLPPCHIIFQFYINNGKISLQLYQRSADVFLGVPFNIASYSLLLIMVAKHLKLVPYEFIHTFGDTHIYENHISQVKEQLKRNPKKLPTLVINNNVKSIFDYKIEDFSLSGYEPHPLIKGKVSV